MINSIALVNKLYIKRDNCFSSANLFIKIYVYKCNNVFVRVRVMVFSATFNNISVISWRSVLLVKELFAK